MEKYKIVLEGTGCELVYGENPNNLNSIEELLGLDSNKFLSAIFPDSYASVICIYNSKNECVEELQIRDNIKIIHSSSIYNIHEFENDGSFHLREHLALSDNDFNILIKGRGTFGEVNIECKPILENIFLLSGGESEEISESMPEQIIIGLVVCDNPDQRKFFMDSLEYGFAFDEIKNAEGIDYAQKGFTLNEFEIIENILNHTHIFDNSNINVQGKIERIK